MGMRCATRGRRWSGLTEGAGEYREKGNALVRLSDVRA